MASEIGKKELTLTQKFWQLNWGLILIISLVASVGFAMLYSAAEGSWDPWASRQAVRFGMGFFLMVVIAVIDIKFWMRLSYILYGIGFLLLVAVEVFGQVGMGAQRWIDLKVIVLQPSEIMKIALVLALARYFHGIPIEDIGRIRTLIIPLLLVFLPIGLILKQPDLGTSLMLVAGSGVIFFLAGVRIWKFALVIVGVLASLPVAWNYLHPYQQNRVLTFLDPERDPLGAGYHIMQSKIAMGAGGMFGKGFMQGSQSQLKFLPEKQTDFIFTMLAEEIGLVGGLGLMGLYALLMIYGTFIAVRCRNHFGRLTALGVTTTFSLYAFINIAMVMGVIPVVGVPLPMVSYGGTAMLTVMIGFGLLMNCYVHRDMRIPRNWREM
ncbi:rod shape-determining protein RodA [Curvivirga aplysinae]|uniref:rod shape-determining protein RodA n=1 Tax=Curvivirga aplysinae TaxID=2529852 RepID=UPI0012BBCFB5|nr:rod shape-determining protein RodA [Curvivirga aplysinae]MTI08685.1 rod shape-determining protein RodA [Curvivirga aplysinae]